MKQKYRVSGNVRGVGEIKEYTHAYSAAQALKLVAMRLANRYPTIPIFIENAVVKESLPPQEDYRPQPRLF